MELLIVTVDYSVHNRTPKVMEDTGTFFGSVRFANEYWLLTILKKTLVVFSNNQFMLTNEIVCRCSRECQVAEWNVHKTECAAFARLTSPATKWFE